MPRLSIGNSTGIGFAAANRLFATVGGGGDSPAILVRNGKATTLAGMCRAFNGLNSIWVDGLINETGSSIRYGCDFLHFDELRMVHGYGRIVFKAIRHVSGSLSVKNWNNPNGTLATNTACVHIGRVNDMGGLTTTLTDCANFEGVHVGGTVVGGYYPYGAHLGKWAVAMGSILSFNPDNNDGQAGTERSGSSGFPTTLVASNIEKMKGGVIDFIDHKGNMTIGADANDTATIIVPREMRRYTITKHASAVVDVGYPTLAQTGLTIA